jgi:hypothetical protein
MYQRFEKFKVKLGWKDWLLILLIGIIAFPRPPPITSTVDSTVIRDVRPRSSWMTDTPLQDEKGWVTIQVFAGHDGILYSRASNKTWFSQVYQDETIASLLNHKLDGYFIDLAANDAIKLSNTVGLERNLNWNGMY